MKGLPLQLCTVAVTLLVMIGFFINRLEGILYPQFVISTTYLLPCRYKDKYFYINKRKT